MSIITRLVEFISLFSGEEIGEEKQKRKGNLHLCGQEFYGMVNNTSIKAKLKDTFTNTNHYIRCARFEGEVKKRKTYRYEFAMHDRDVLKNRTEQNRTEQKRKEKNINNVFQSPSHVRASEKRSTNTVMCTTTLLALASRSDISRQMMLSDVWTRWLLTLLLIAVASVATTPTEATHTDVDINSDHTAACTSELDCQLNGACVQGACVCDKGWRGTDCGTLNLELAPIVA